jgi:hypothetical protein
MGAPAELIAQVTYPEAFRATMNFGIPAGAETSRFRQRKMRSFTLGVRIWGMIPRLSGSRALTRSVRELIYQAGYSGDQMRVSDCPAKQRLGWQTRITGT